MTKCGPSIRLMCLVADVQDARAYCMSADRYEAAYGRWLYGSNARSLVSSTITDTLATRPMHGIAEVSLTKP